MDDKATVLERIAWRYAQLGLYLLWRKCLPEGTGCAPRARRLMAGLCFLLEGPGA